MEIVSVLYTTWPLVWSSFLTNGYTPSRGFLNVLAGGVFYYITLGNHNEKWYPDRESPVINWSEAMAFVSLFFFCFLALPHLSLSLLNYNLHNLRWKTSARTITSIQKKRGGNIFRCKDWEEFNLNKSREKWEFSLSLSFKSFGRDLLAGGTPLLFQ